MLTKKSHKIILLGLLTLLLIGIASATENQTNTDKTSIIQEKITTQTEIQTIQEKNTEINKKTTKSVKTATNKKTTKLTINNVPNTYYTDTVEISGKLSTKDQNLNGRSITLKINKNTVIRKTNEEGIFTYTYKTKIPGKNNITATYNGNKYYSMVKTTKTFRVTRMPTQINIDNGLESTVGKTEYINGLLTNNNFDGLKNTKIYVYLNGAKKSVKTDPYGYFTYKFTAQKVGKNTLTAQLVGTNKYIGSKKTITFKVNKLNTYTYQYQPVYNKTNKKIEIKGYTYDEQNKYLKKAPIIINISGKYHKTTTDKYGHFYYQTKPTKIGINTITITFRGNNKYTKSSVKKTINIPLIKTTKITMDSISKTSLGNYVYITGQFTDNNYNALINTNIILTINGKKYNTKTDEYGYYYYQYKTTKTGTNKVTATFKGNTNYKTSSTTKTFTVTKFNTVELYTHLLTGPYPDDSKRVGDDVFKAWYQLTDRQHDKGVHFTVMDYYIKDLGDPPHNLIVDATFYFKNNAGKIISKKFESGTGDSMYHSLVSGYTPYKVVAEYRKMTSAEKNKWYYGYGYNPKTKKWFSYY
ncbi:hypothetical protein PXD04_11130 (plasmid) [Methanosphaera sp. ISO3-F5]|uniref:hypothetical protein n=1 Tax=Methanosphaera sp. ISO3-F5 TaxID=1452353 RepID=UPI002B25CFAD|nr:hypothetical protein [Methanosphaera sp. ISO3-F5]WQH65427.1 hypothetical protein PXD04_11130 [Methanosphaera sp. ISO3-F5]